MIEVPADAERMALSFVGITEERKTKILAALRKMPPGQLEQEIKKAASENHAEARFVRFLFIGQASQGGALASPANKRVKPMRTA